MRAPAAGDYALRITLPASDPAVEEFFVEFRRRAQCALPGTQWFQVELLAREAMTNAVQHGCHADPSRTIHCIFRLKGRRMTMVFDDRGEGFDWRAAWNRQAALSDCSGRGMELLRTFATRVRFNEKGNKVTIVKQCQ